jgi:hypothetical protein
MFLVLRAAFTANCQTVITHFDLDVVLRQARQVSSDNEGVVTLKDFDRREKEPRACSLLTLATLSEAALAKVVIHVLHKTPHQGKGRSAQHLEGVHSKQRRSEPTTL